MKVIAFLDCALGAGGGFDQALNALMQMKRLCTQRYEFEVVTTQGQNLGLLDELKIKATLFSFSWIDRWLGYFSNTSIYRRIQTRFKISSSLEKKLIECSCDLVYFVTPSSLGAGFQRLNYISTLWDLCHRDCPEFPEVRQFNSFYFREENFSNTLPAAFLILTDSPQLADLASCRYGVDRSRFLPMPYGPSPLVLANKLDNESTVLSLHQLGPGYFLYPAQFWAHKNHIRLLQALLVLKEKYKWEPILVFLGKDYGNLAHITQFIEENGLCNQVKVTGFVPSDQMKTFYLESLAVVMPTYFGPTNLPPLEAWTFNKPLIYSSHLSEQVGEAAILFDPDSKEDLAEAMYAVLDPMIQVRLISAGKKKLNTIANERCQAELHLSDSLKRFSLRRQCWE